MRKRVLFSILIIFSFNLTFAQSNYSRESKVSYNGVESFYIIPWESILLGIIPVAIENDFDWNFYLEVNGTDKLCYYNSNNKKIYVKKNTNITISYTMSGGHSEQIDEYLYVNGISSPEGSYLIKENTLIEYKMKGPISDEEYTILTVYVYPDDDVPEILVNNKSDNGIYFSALKNEINISIKDNTSGICICKNGNSYFPENSKLTYNGVYNIYVEDLVGHKKEREIIVDSVEPKIVFSYSGATINSKSWTNNSYIYFSDANKIYSPTHYYLNSLEITSPYQFSTGKHTIKAKDEAGNESDSEIWVDTIKPNIKCTKLEYIKNGRAINELKFEVTTSDNNSGVKETSTRYKNNEKYKNLVRTTTNIFELSASVTDFAGNSNKIQWENTEYKNKGKVNGDNLKIVLPPYINFNTETKTETNGEKTTVKFKLDNCNEDFINYTNWVNIERRFYVPGKEREYIEITKENFLEYFELEKLSTWEKLTQPVNIRSNIRKEDGNYYYIDSIRTETGFGHMVTGYTLTWETRDLSTQENSEEIFVKPTADAPAVINLRIKGKNEEYLFMEIKNNKITYLPNDKFEIPGNGRINLEYKIENLDCEPYEMEIREMIKIPEPEASDFLSIGMEGFIQRGAMKGCKTHTYDDIEDNKKCYNKDEWQSFKEPIFLYFNKPMNLQIYTKEGYLYESEGKSYGQEGYTSEIIQLKAEPQDLGGFKLIVGKDAGYNDNGIIAKPFQNVDMYITSEKIQEIEWNFGDNTTSNELLVEHKWDQLDTRQDDTSEYTLRITYGGNSAKIPVHIVDTQYGKLYGNEIWRGNHKILSKIEISEDQKLTIGDYTNKEAEILCIGDLIEEYKAEIYVEKGADLIIKNGTKIEFIESRNNANGYVAQEEICYGWKGIVVEGSAEIENAEFKYADRGITILDGGILTIKNCDFIEDKIAIHLLENTKPLITNINILGCYDYGIKQEEESDIEIKNSVISDNTINWYDQNETELTDVEIIEKIGE